MKMKKSLLAMAVGGALVPMLAHADFNFYGRLNTDYEYSKVGSGVNSVGSFNQISGLIGSSYITSPNASGSGLKNNNSRLGVRGSEDLGGGLKGIFQLETAFDSATGASGLGGTLRDTYAGFQSDSWGRLRAGRISNINYAATIGTLPDVNYDTGSSSDGLYRLAGETPGTGSTFYERMANVVEYKTPNFGGFVGTVQHSGNPTNGTLTNTAGSTARQNDANLWAVNGQFSQGPLYLTLGVTTFKRENVSTAGSSAGGLSTTDATAAGSKFDDWNFAAQYDFKVIKAGLFWERFKDKTSGLSLDAFDYYRVSLSIPVMGSNEVVVNAGRSNLKNNSLVGTSGHGKLFQVGYKHNLSKTLRLYTWYQHFNGDDSVSDNEIKTLSAGLSYNF